MTSLLDDIASCPQIRSLAIARDFIREMEMKGWRFINLKGAGKPARWCDCVFMADPPKPCNCGWSEWRTVTEGK